MDFRRARRRARLQAVLARIRGKSIDLLSYDDVRSKLKGLETAKQELREIPLDAIVGSVGRYRDFTRSFLPRTDHDEQRWAKIKAATMYMGGVPPIEVYQLGEAYFVQDGNHRVSVAQQAGATHIQAYVRKVRTKVPITADIDAEDLILKAEYADLLERTELPSVRPEADLSVTVPGRYSLIYDQIKALKQSRDGEQLSNSQAAEHWYDEIYLPFIRVIRDQGIRQDFPGLTETDLYIWISRYRKDLEQALGWEVSLEAAAADMARRSSTRAGTVFSRVRQRLKDALTPAQLESGPAPGAWRQEVLSTRGSERFTSDILVPLSGAVDSWAAWDQAMIVADREDARLLGLHVVASDKDRGSQQAQLVREQFEKRFERAGKPYKLAVDVGGVARKICDRARWADLVVVKLSHPPGEKRISRLSSGFRMLIHRCGRPILAVPSAASPLNKVLLAYDGSPKSREALFLATYFAGRWKIPLVIVTVEGTKVSQEILQQGQSYIERRDVVPTLVAKRGEVSQAILETAEQHGCDFITIGGYGRGAVKEVVLGSTVDRILRESQKPVLICR
jgi:nucleotide-binding universal stress UspA family protein